MEGGSDKRTVYVVANPEEQYRNYARDGLLKTDFNYKSILCRHKNWFAELEPVCQCKSGTTSDLH